MTHHESSFLRAPCQEVCLAVEGKADPASRFTKSACVKEPARGSWQTSKVVRAGLTQLKPQQAVMASKRISKELQVG